MGDSDLVQRPSSAGQINACEGDSHGVRSLHVVVRCECGAAFQSTDGTIALAMAERHASREDRASRERPVLPSQPHEMVSGHDLSRSTGADPSPGVGPDRG